MIRNLYLKKMCGIVVWKNSVDSCVESFVEKLGGTCWERTVYSVQCTVYRVQCTVYSVQCTMYSMVVILNLLRDPQDASVWGVELFARLLLCLTPQEDLNEQLLGTSKWSEIWLSGTPKWSEIWLSGTPKLIEIWLSGTPNGVKFFILKKLTMHFFGIF